MAYDIHFCLISKQAAPNLLPILDKKFKPKKAVFFVSNQMKSNADYLKQVFIRKQVEVEIVALENEFDFARTANEFIDKVSAYENENIALNVTGGTKLISIAASEAFNYVGKPIFYMDTETNRILFLSRDEKNQWQTPLSLQAEVDLEIYLSSYGKKILNSKGINKRKDWLAYMELLIRNYDSNHNIIPLLNKSASNSSQNAYKYKLDNKERKILFFEDFLRNLAYYDLIDIDNDVVNFRNKEVKEFLSGGWLEDYIYSSLQGIDKIDDILLNVELGTENYKQHKKDYDIKNKGNKNEVDILLVAKNKLHIIECKTQLMGKDGGEKSEDILYKLETIKNYGGLMSKKCLVSYCAVPESVLNRAKFLNIKIIQGRDIVRARQLIQEWIG